MREEAKRGERQDLTPGSILSKWRLSLCMLMAVGLFIFCNPAKAEKPSGGEKFHLFMMAVTDQSEIKVDTPARVEPLFLSNGEELIIIYDYCRRAYARSKGKSSGIPVRWQGTRHLKDDEMSPSDLRDVKRYCNNESLILSGKEFQGMNGVGEKVVLNEIRFSPNEGEENEMPPKIPLSGATSISSPNTTALVAKGTKTFPGAKHFFLVSRSTSLLKKIVLPGSIDKENSDELLKRAIDYGESVKGIYTRACAVRQQENEVCQGLGHPGPSIDRRQEFAWSAIEVILTGVSDVDMDGLPDVLFGMRSMAPTKSGTGKQEKSWDITWSALGMLKGNGQKVHYSGVEINHSIKFSAFFYMPLATINVGKCIYLITNTETTQEDILFLAQPSESKICRNQLTYKRLP